MNVGRVGVAFGEQRRGDDEVRRGAVVGNGNVIDLGYAQKGLHVGIVGLGRERIGEEDDDVDMAFGHLRAYLLIAAERTAEVGRDGKPRFFIDEVGRGAGAAEKMPGENLTVFRAPFDEAFLHVVVGDESDVLGGIHGFFHVFLTFPAGSSGVRCNLTDRLMIGGQYEACMKKRMFFYAEK